LNGWPPSQERSRKNHETWGTLPLLGWLELVQSVERGDFVGFRQSGIVENRITEILDTRSQGENDLADVNDFRRPIANGMHSEQFERIRVEDQLQQALVISQHLAFRQFRIAGQAHFIVDVFFGQLFFGLPYH